MSSRQFARAVVILLNKLRDSANRVHTNKGVLFWLLGQSMFVPPKLLTVLALQFIVLYFLRLKCLPSKANEPFATENC